MDPKAPIGSLCLYKETRSNLNPLQSNVLIQIQIPSTSTFSVRPKQQRRIISTPPTYRDEDTYKSECLASCGSLYFGRLRRHPRSFLWRVLAEGKVLELRSADLSKGDHEAREALIALQFCFPVALKHGCVGLADSEEPDSLTVFALTKGNELYTFTLRKDFFCHTAASKEDVSKWCKASKPATFSISTPFRLIALNTLQLVVSLGDGRLLVLSRGKGDDGSKWRESTYGDGQWAASLRGLIPWRGSNTIKYDGAVLEQGTPTALSVSPDGNHIFAVCLDHTLRVWNPKKATSVFSKDLLWEHREPQEIPAVMLDPGNPNALQIFQSDGGMEGDLYYAVTFSPHDFGQFKFWGIRDPDHGEKGVRDLFPDCPLKPPDPDPNPESKAIWKVADFKVKGERDGKGTEMWVLMRSNRHYKLYNLKFDILDLAVVWQDQWSTMASEALDQEPPPQISDVDPYDATDKWLDFLLGTQKYPESVLETALGMYCSEHSIAMPNARAPLKERMCTAIASQVEYAGSDDNLATFRKIIDQEWSALWQDIRDLDKARWSILCLQYDNHTQMPWIAFADGCSAIRTCDKVELIVHNSSKSLGESVGMLDAPSVELDPPTEPKLPDELAVIIEAAATFRRSFSYPLRQICSSVLAEELWLDPSYSVPLRIQYFYDRCNFGEEIDSALFDELTNALAPIGGFNGLETEIFNAVLDEFSHSLPLEKSKFLHTIYGRQLLINGAREMIHIRESILFDLLTLTVFVDMEIDRDEVPMEDFDASRVYVRLLGLLKQYQISRWLAWNIRIEKGDSPEATEDGSPSDSLGKSVTVLESIFARDLSAESDKALSQSEELTYGIKDLLQYIIGGNEDIPLDGVLVYIQTNLLVNNDIDLASDFLRFQPSTAWSTYIKGRLFLLKGEITEAAICFKKAAFKLSRPSSFNYQAASNNLLTPLDALSFGNGLPTYYTHILNLFDSHSHPTQMSHFAHLALQHLPTDSPNTNLRTTLLTSLFQASLQTTDHPTAYSALTRHPHPETLLPSLISALLTTPNALPHLLSLPFPPTLHSQIDTILSSPKSKATPKIVAAWRLHHDDFRGAAAALLPPLQAAQAKVKRGGEGLEEEYLAVINLLACAGRDEGWVLSRDGQRSGKRKVVTVGDVRGGYQRELDRRSVLESGRFGFVAGGDEMDVG